MKTIYILCKNHSISPLTTVPTPSSLPSRCPSLLLGPELGASHRLGKLYSQSFFHSPNYNCFGTCTPEHFTLHVSPFTEWLEDDNLEPHTYRQRRRNPQEFSLIPASSVHQPHPLNKWYPWAPPKHQTSSINFLSLGKV